MLLELPGDCGDVNKNCSVRAAPSLVSLATLVLLGYGMFGDF